MLALAVVIILSYLVGAIPSSLWVGRLHKGIDLRNYGSGNLGTTNTFRILGWKAGVVVGLIDLAKGFVAAFFISQLGHVIGDGAVTIPYWELDAFLKIVAGVAAVLGHMYSPYAGFDGGKGVLTAAGMLLGIEQISILLAMVVFTVILLSSRYVSLASIIASFMYPLFLVMLRYGFGFEIDGSIIILAAILAVTIIVKHHENLRRLRHGNENRISSFSPAKGWLNKEQGVT